MLRITFLCHPTFGGSARVALELARSLGERGHDVSLLASARPFAIDRMPRGVTFQPLRHGSTGASGHLDADWPEPDLRASVEQLGAAVEARPPDVLHYHYALPFAYLAARLKDALDGRCPPVVGTLHGTDVTGSGQQPTTGAALRHALTRADALTTVSHSHAALAHDTFGLPRGPQVIPNFVDLARFRPRRRRHGRRARIVHVSNFRPVKDPARMARVFLRVRQHLDAELWLVGDGPLLPRVRRALQATADAGDVRYFGLRTDVESLVAEADVLLVTSREDSFCLAALEAAACGVPVVAPRVGGIPEVVDDGVTGQLFDPLDERAAARAVIAILRHASRGSALGKAGRIRATRFSADVVVPQYEELYRRVIARRAEVGGRVHASGP
jgi:L-malate glycosyltransferase